MVVVVARLFFLVTLWYELEIKTKMFFKLTFWNFNWRHKLIAQKDLWKVYYSILTPTRDVLDTVLFVTLQTKNAEVVSTFRRDNRHILSSNHGD